jgi:hypothetical protein
MTSSVPPSTTRLFEKWREAARARGSLGSRGHLISAQNHHQFIMEAYQMAALDSYTAFQRTRAVVISYGIMNGTMNTILSMLVERVSQLPDSVQAEATRSLLDIENRHSILLALDADRDGFVQEGIDAYERGAWSTHADAMAAAYTLVAA